MVTRLACSVLVADQRHGTTLPAYLVPHSWYLHKVPGVRTHTESTSHSKATIVAAAHWNIHRGLSLLLRIVPGKAAIVSICVDAAALCCVHCPLNCKLGISRLVMAPLQPQDAVDEFRELFVEATAAAVILPTCSCIMSCSACCVATL